MNRRLAILTAATLAGLVGLLWSRQSSAAAFGMDLMQTKEGDYSANPNYVRLAPTIEAAAIRYGIPSGLLDRLLYQESRYRSDIINGDTTSAVGAKGIAQFMPATAAELGVDPLDPRSAIPGAARYLARLYRAFGSWPLALAAYNWGPGNVSGFLSGQRNPPTETRNYVAAISGQPLTA